MGDWDGLVVVCGATPWAGTRLLDQHLATHLTRYAPVLYVDPPVSALTRFRNRRAAEAAVEPGLRQIAPRLSHLSVRVPPLKERPGGKALALALTRRAMRRAVTELGARDVHAVVVPSLDPLFGVLDERFSVFYAADDYVAGASLMGIRTSRLVRRAARQPRDADLVVTVSPTLSDQLEFAGPLLIPNGCDVDVYRNVPPPPRDEEPTVAFVGHLSDRVDLRLLEAVAATDVRLLLIGPRQATRVPGPLDELVARPNVTWTGPVPYDDLPVALAGVTTCLLPYGDTAFNRASFPLKVLEYLAAGRRVVATPLPAVEWLGTSLIRVAADPEAFAAEVAGSVATPLTREEMEARRLFASGHTWEKRMAVLADALGLDPATSGDVGSGTGGGSQAMGRAGS